MIHEISISDYVAIADTLPIIDVRSPGEFEKGHIHNAVNIPLFTNEERAHVGTVYVKQSKEKAIEVGYTYVNPKLAWFVQESKKVASNSKVAVHCWRGGMRSQSFAGLLSENGLEVYLIQKGYKAFRNYAIETINQPSTLIILGGYTGSGKTKILNLMQAQGQQVIDLEGIANHKGSAFGAIGCDKQPTTEQFENNLFWQWKELDLSKPIWLEDESANIGNANLPQELFQRMRNSKVIFLKIPKEQRAELLVGDYANINDEAVANAISRISKRLGGLKTQQSLNMLAQKDYYGVALLCLDYYDKYYLKGLSKRDKEMVQIIESEVIDVKTNTKNILNIWKK